MTSSSMFIVLFSTIALFCIQGVSAVVPATCGSIDIRNHPTRMFFKDPQTIARYQNCTVLEGTFSMSMITNGTYGEDEFVVFPNIVEITGYVLIFNVKSLSTLSRILPNLRVIGGNDLIMNYALIVYQNPDLKDIGLPNLRVIRNGGVRISENPLLCYAKNIDWKRFLYGPIDDIIVHDGSALGQECVDECDDQSRSCLNNGGMMSCWNATTCQEDCSFDRAESILPEAGPGCVEGTTEVPCHRQCVGGCYAQDDPTECVACRNYFFGDRCVTHCPEGYFTYLSRCLTEAECRVMAPLGGSSMSGGQNFKAVDGHCTLECPIGYEEESIPNSDPHAKPTYVCRKCQGDCEKRCIGGRIVDTEAAAMELRDCNIYEGDLDIQMRMSSRKDVVARLTVAFQSIRTVTGHMIVRFSPGLVSLSMFKNLTTIKGQSLYQDRYALVIYENQNLRQLFPEEIAKKLVIEKGTVQVHNNRMLCYQKIKSMMEEMGLANQINAEDQSMYSNGDKAICDESTFNINVKEVSEVGFKVEWDVFNTSEIDHRKFLGYQIFYKKIDHSNASLVSIDADRSACSDSWKMHFHPSSNRSDHRNTKKAAVKESELIFDGIASDSYYAVYVQTRMVNHQGATNAMSKVTVIKTGFGTPTPPRMRTSNARDTDKIWLEWDPPEHPNGNITHYVIKWTSSYKDESYAVRHVCEHTNRPRIGGMGGGHAISEDDDELHSTTSPATTLAAYIRGQRNDNNEGAQCSAIPGCCSCGGDFPDEPDFVPSDDDLLEDRISHEFENAIQNRVFVQGCEFAFDPKRCGPPKADPTAIPRIGNDTDVDDDVTTVTTRTPKMKGLRRRRRGHGYRPMRTMYKKIAWEGGVSTIRVEENGGSLRKMKELSKRIKKRSIAEATSLEKAIVEPTLGSAVEIKSADDVTVEAGEVEGSGGPPPTERPNYEMPHSRGFLADRPDPISETEEKNVTAPSDPRAAISTVIDGLRHYTQYQITILACQDVNAKVHHCSNRPIYQVVRTNPIREKDLVNSDTIKPLSANESASAMVTFDSPEDPNGRILGFKVTLANTNGQATPIDQCVNADDFQGGVIFDGLADGSYQVQVRTITMAGISDAVIGSDILEINTPGWLTPSRILMIVGCLILLFLVGGVIIWQGVNKYYGKRVGEYIRQTITANPEYLSQFDVYKQDEWELKRTDIELKEEIGRGTFGKVFRGFGKDIKSQCGEKFGLCAVKTVSETANPGERLHFLIEASVMKQFNTAFIIKLYGVVSDGQPVLVVMEMMEKGNLRDYLRSRRPDSDENVDNLPVPSESQYFEWAAQIADGMAYLEHLKFCHRDLAARNCMVGADDVVKIGDFGMARDIYYHEYYKPTGKRLMPVRWMAPESLRDGKFSLKSDVWSYGIVLYEMLTLAQQPYQGLANDQVFNYIGVSRKILDPPTDCPLFWYELMCACWKYQSRDRPSFKQIVDHLVEFTSQHFRENSWVLNDGAEYDDCGAGGEGAEASGESPYVAEGHGMVPRTEMTVEEGGAMCIANRRNGESGGIYQDEIDELHHEAEAEAEL